MTVLKITTDGDPYPALAGGSNIGGSGEPVNSGTRYFANSINIFEQDKSYTFDYRGGSGGILINSADQTEYTGADIIPSNPHDVYINDDGVFELRPIGVMLNGVPLYPSGVKQDSIGTSSGSLTFNVPEIESVEGPNGKSVYPLDRCGGVPESGGEYRYRSGAFFERGWVGNELLKNSSIYLSAAKDDSEPFSDDFLRHPGGTYDNKVFTSGHSKIIGYAFDGFPIYGPYGYSNPFDSSSPIVKMQSSYSARTAIEIETLERQSFVDYEMGSFIEDYSYDPTLYSNNTTRFLDEHNGRFCITPDYKKGTYAYFLTLSNDETDTPTYPYFIGPTTKERRSQ